MNGWICNIIENQYQDFSEDSFIGGKPKIPQDFSLPYCELCGKELTFFFQVAFPFNHAWYGKSLALFYCTEHYHGDLCIPEFPDIQDLLGANIPIDFLRKYEKNFRILIFDTHNGVTNKQYVEKVTFKSLQLIENNGADSNADFLLAGAPVWIMGFDETPATINTIKSTLLLQIKEDYVFDKLQNAPAQEDVFGEPRKENFYKLFVADRIYFWGTKDLNMPLVYVSVQAP